MKGKEKHITDKDVLQTLPRNRREVFFDLIKHRKMTLFSLSSFTFMFFIPLAVDLFYFNYVESLAIAADKKDHLFSLLFYSMLIVLPCMIVGFIGLAGAFYVAKKMVWQEGISMAHDFSIGIKENWKHSLINGVLFGLFLFGLVVGGSYLAIFTPIQPIWTGIGIGAIILMFMLFGMVISLNFTQDVYYQNTCMITRKN